MRYIWDNPWFFIPAALFLGLGSLIAFAIPYGAEILYFNELRHEPFNALFEFFTNCGEAWAFVLFGGLLCFWKPRYAMLVAIVGLLALPVGYIAKDTIGVDRPITFFEKKSQTAQLVLVPGIQLNRGQTSFPSGHTMAAFALYSLLALMTGQRYQRWGLPLVLVAILTGISRIFLVQHFLVDVLGGAIFGLLLSGLIWTFSARFLKDTVSN